MSSSTENLELFFDRLWKDVEGYAYIPSRDSSNSWKNLFFEWPRQKPLVIKYAEMLTSQNKEVYFSPALYKEPKPGRDYVLGSHVLWADFDGNAPERWDRLPEGITEPSLRVQTSSPANQHVYWDLSEFVTDLDYIEKKNRSIAYSLDSDTACWNANRIMRPPATVNYGYSKPERKGKSYDVEFAELSDRRYTIHDFDHLKPVRSAIKDSLTLTEKLPIEQVMMEATWTPELTEFFTRPIEKFEEGFWWSRGLVSMAMQAAELGWSDIQIYTIISDADDRWGKFRDRSDRDLQRSNIVEKARRKHPYGLADVNFAGLLGARTEIAPQVVYTYGEFRKLDIHIEWVFEGLLALAGYGIFFGQSGVGKTQLILQMCRAIATGSDFLSYKNKMGTPRKVMFFSLEMGPESLKFFMDNMEKEVSEEELALLSENLLIVPLVESMNLNRPEGQKFFQDIVKEHQPDLVFIDSLGTMRQGTLNDDATAIELLNYIQKFKKTFGCAVVVVHHANKANTGPELTLTDFFRSQFLYSGTDFVVGVAFNEKDDRSILRLTSCKIRLGPPKEPQIIYRTKHLTFKTFGENSGFASDDSGESGSGTTTRGFDF